LKPAFLGENFLLRTRTARELYHDHAAGLPILDYHNHLPPGEIAGDRRFENLTRIWLAGDHYKWRAMRTCGISENRITGSASDEDKFLAWAETVPHTLRNPLYHWTHMELKNPLGIDDRLLGPATAKGIWRNANRKLAAKNMSVRGILRGFNVRLVCTTDDPTDDLRHHRAMAAEPGAALRMAPAFRPDPVFAMADATAWNAWTDRLAQAADLDVASWDSLLAALERRCDFFHANGCRLSDHGLENIVFEPCSLREARSVVRQLRAGRGADRDAALRVRSLLLVELGRMYHRRGWTQQFHLGALRGVNSRAKATLGSDSGHDTIGDFPQAAGLARLLDALDRDDRLAKTILYNLNPADNEVMAAMVGSFQDGSAPGKIQYGSAWWFLDQKDGMEKQIDALSNLGLLSRFVGMLTDSRSFLSFSRHEYFRRILCNRLGDDVENGLVPRDLKLLGGMVRDICYRNAERYFGFDLQPVKETA